MKMQRAGYSLKVTNHNKDRNTYHYEVKLPMELGWLYNVKLLIDDGNSISYGNLSHKKNEGDYAIFEGDVTLETSAIYRYCFSYDVDGKTYYFNKNGLQNDAFLSDDCFKLSVNFEVPKWAQGKIMYHIFVDRFNKSKDNNLQEMPRRVIHDNWNEEMHLGPEKEISKIYGKEIWNIDFYGGNLNGITEKLDYIKSLGVSILYLSPIVHSQSNHRYDTADYENVDPYAGCNDDLKVLCDEAHKRGMKVVLDAVFNHTGNDSKYFDEYKSFGGEGAYNNPMSKYSNFYKRRYENGKIYYEYWWGFENLPECDFESKEWQEYITGVGGVIDKWFDLGIDGLRLDVADELSDDFIEKIRIAVKRNKADGFIMGEVWKNPMRMGRGYISSGKCMDTVMNYPLIDALLRYYKYADCNKLDYIIRDILREYPEETINSLMNFTSTHDISRAINYFTDENEFNEYAEWAWDLKNNDLDYLKNKKLSKEEYEKAKEKYKSYLFALYFLPGNVSIFYGDEVGVDGYGNLLNRKTYPWGMEDKDLLEYFKKLGKDRNDEIFLETADLKIRDINRDYFSYERIGLNDKMLVITNRSGKEGRILIPPEYNDKKAKIYTLNKSTKDIITPYGAIAIKKAC